MVEFCSFEVQWRHLQGAGWVIATTSFSAGLYPATSQIWTSDRLVINTCNNYTEI